jgi:hypothetical protein
MTGNNKKRPQNARERLWPFVTCYQYIQPIRSVKEFSSLQKRQLYLHHLTLQMGVILLLTIR